jgi:phosphatidate cytidylyltransferase
MGDSVLFNSNLKARILASSILIPLVLFIVYLGGIAMTFFVMIVAVLMSFEWCNLTSKSDKKKKAVWKIIGVFYIALPASSLLYISNQGLGREIIIWLFVTVWAADTAAFFVGKTLGGPRLAPNISPNKTWSGFLGAVVSSYCVGILSRWFFSPVDYYAIVILTVTIGVYAQIGDLIESWIKRHFGVKDSGGIIPGHGGILDRVDGIVVTAPKVALVLMLEGYCKIF